MHSILIVDDMESIHEMLDTVIQPIGYSTLYASNGQDAITLFKEKCPEIVLTDLRMPEMDGLELMARIKEIDSSAVVIMMSGHADVDNALASLKLGAFDYLTKPFKVDQLMAAIERASKLIEESIQSEERGSTIALLGDSAPAQELKQKVAQSASSSSPVLIKGPAGIQKALIAMAIHNAVNEESDAPFLSFDCAENSESDFAESIVGEDSKSGSLVEQAKKGSLLLSNIDRLSKDSQITVGTLIREQGSDVRFFFSTSEDIEGLVAKGEFDDSLFYRISSQSVNVLGLSERSEDIPLIANSILQGLGDEPVSLSDPARSLLQAYSWPGNLVELKEVMEGAATHCKDATIQAEDLPDRIRENKNWPSLSEFIEQASTEYKHRILRACFGDAEKASSILGCDLSEIPQD